MLKEIAGFSRELEKAGIYDRVEQRQQRIDKPIIIIPINDDLSDILIDDSCVLFKDIFVEKCQEAEKMFAVLDSPKGERKIEIASEDEQLLKNISTLENFSDNKEFQNILKNLANYTKKMSSDAKGNKSIGGNAGTNSYHILVFSAKKDGLFENKEKFSSKIGKTYCKENIVKGVMEDIGENKENWIKLLAQMSEVQKTSTLYEFYNKVSNLTQDGFEEFYIILKTPRKDIANNIYKKWYDGYLEKKLFKSEESHYPKGDCFSCNEKDQELWLPDEFHNLDQNKSFIKHLGRKSTHNIAVCRRCAFHLYKFREVFLHQLRISVFPLFVDKSLNLKSLNLIERNEKINFSEVVKEIYRKTSVDNLDFYLVIYSRSSKLVAFDYVTGFQFYRNDMSLFRFQNILDRFFLNSKLKNNYLTDPVDTGNKSLDMILYRYRSQIFDYIYRAKYNSLNKKDMKDICCDSLTIKMKDLYESEKEGKTIGSIVNMIDNYYIIDNYFGGKSMETVDKIKRERTVNDIESLSYYAGQVVRYLLSQSEKKDKKHSMVEPFINVNNLGTFSIKLDELFSAYKHALSLNYERFNSLFSTIWAFLYDNRKEKFTKDMKILFYAGYFDKDNILFEKSTTENNNNEEENND